jgi:hypothetical protein
MPTVLLGPLIPQHQRGCLPAAGLGEVYFLLPDCPDDLWRERIRPRPSWRSRDIEEQAEFGRWLRRNIADHVDTSRGSPEDAAAAIAAWVAGHITQRS